MKARLYNLFAAAALLMLVAACKPAGQSETKSLENFAAGKRVRTNVCAAHPKKRDKNKDIRQFVKVSNKAKSKAAAKIVDEVLSAVPRGVLEFFVASNGMIHIVDSPTKACLKATQGDNKVANIVQQATKEIDEGASCSLQAARKTRKTKSGLHAGLPPIDIFVPTRPEVMRHELLRQFGIVLYTYYNQTNIVIDAEKKEVAGVLQGGPPLASMSYATEKLTHAYLLDLVRLDHLFSFDSVDVILGKGAGQTLNQMMLRQGRVSYAPIERSFESILRAAVVEERARAQVAIRAASFRAMVALEAFDSFYCNDWGKFDSKLVGQLVDEKIDPSRRDAVLAAQDNSHDIFQRMFPGTYDVFMLYMVPIIRNMESDTNYQALARKAVRDVRKKRAKKSENSGFGLTQQSEEEYLKRAETELTAEERREVYNAIHNNAASRFLQEQLYQARNNVDSIAVARLLQAQQRYEQVEPQIQLRLREAEGIQQQGTLVRMMADRDFNDESREALAKLNTVTVQPRGRNPLEDALYRHNRPANPFGTIDENGRFVFNGSQQPVSQVVNPFGADSDLGAIFDKRMRGQEVSRDELQVLRRRDYDLGKRYDAIPGELEELQAAPRAFHQLTQRRLPEDLQRMLPVLQANQVNELPAAKAKYIAKMTERYPHIDAAELETRIDRMITEDDGRVRDFYDQPGVRRTAEMEVAGEDYTGDLDYLVQGQQFDRKHGLDPSVNNNVQWQIREIVQRGGADKPADYNDLIVGAVKDKDAWIDAVDAPLEAYQTKAEIAGMTPVAGIFADAAATGTAATRYVISGGKKSSVGEIALNGASGIPVLGYLADGTKMAKNGTRLAKYAPTFNRVVTNPGFLKTEMVTNGVQITAGGSMFAKAMYDAATAEGVPPDKRRQQMADMYQKEFGIRPSSSMDMSEMMFDANMRRLSGQLEPYQEAEQQLTQAGPAWGSASTPQPAADDAVGGNPFAVQSQPTSPVVDDALSASPFAPSTTPATDDAIGGNPFAAPPAAQPPVQAPPAQQPAAPPVAQPPVQAPPAQQPAAPPAAGGNETVIFE